MAHCTRNSVRFFKNYCSKDFKAVSETMTTTVPLQYQVIRTCQLDHSDPRSEDTSCQKREKKHSNTTRAGNIRRRSHWQQAQVNWRSAVNSKIKLIWYLPRRSDKKRESQPCADTDRPSRRRLRTRIFPDVDRSDPWALVAEIDNDRLLDPLQWKISILNAAKGAWLACMPESGDIEELPPPPRTGFGAQTAWAHRVSDQKMRPPLVTTKKFKP